MINCHQNILTKSYSHMRHMYIHIVLGRAQNFQSYFSYTKTVAEDSFEK